MDELIRLLNEGNYSCVVRQGEETRTFSRRGVADLYDLYATDRAFLKGAWLGDKVIGKGAAALMVLGGVSRVWTRVVSTPALALLRKGGVEVPMPKKCPASSTAPAQDGVRWKPFATCRTIPWNSIP